MGFHALKLHPEFEKEVRDAIPRWMSMDLLIKWVFLDAWAKGKHSFKQMKKQAEGRANQMLRQQRIKNIEEFIKEQELKNANKKN